MRRINYNKISRTLLVVQELPHGVIPIYYKLSWQERMRNIINGEKDIINPS